MFKQKHCHCRALDFDLRRQPLDEGQITFATHELQCGHNFFRDEAQFGISLLKVTAP